jgi:hypothetical protein
MGLAQLSTASVLWALGQTIHVLALSHFMSSTSASSPRSTVFSFSSRTDSSRRRRFAAPYCTLLDGKRRLALLGEGAAAAALEDTVAGISAAICTGDASPEEGVEGDGDGGEFMV